MGTSAGRPRRPPTVGRPKGRFTQHRRLDKLREVLESEPRGLPLGDLAGALRVSPRSVRRYLKELGGVTDVESIETTPGGAHLWRIKPSERGRTVPLRRAQAYALLATRRALDVIRGSALHDELDLALGHIDRVAQIPFRTSTRAEIRGDHGLETRFFVVPPAAKNYVSRGGDIDELFRAVADLRVVHLRPRTKASEAAPADREPWAFHPYAILVHRGAVVIVGRRSKAPGGAVEVVPLEAIGEVRASEDEHFLLPPSFDVRRYLHGEFGVAPPATGRAIVEFDARVADDVRARRVHPEQRVATSPDGRVRLSVPLANVDLLASWVLSWGDAARVVEPDDLAQHVAQILERAAAKYRKPT